MTIAVPAFRRDGSLMDMVNPVASDIAWPEVANTLSKIARFNGRYAAAPYSVAQHCVMGADALMNETGDAVVSGYFLLHDVNEDPFGDITRPTIETIEHFVRGLLREHGIRSVPPRLVQTATERARRRFDTVIFEAAGLPHLDRMPAYRRQVEEMDERMLRAEVSALYGESAVRRMQDCTLPPPRLTGAIKPWGPMKAEETWLDRLHRYLGIEGRVHG
jgi:uncharacterized protein